MQTVLVIAALWALVDVLVVGVIAGLSVRRATSSAPGDTQDAAGRAFPALGIGETSVSAQNS